MTGQFAEALNAQNMVSTVMKHDVWSPDPASDAVIVVVFGVT